jgi:pyridoxamine 5'-phosphate oxidase
MDDLAPWRSPLAKNLHVHRADPSARYLQLATVTPAGLPANRTIVFRSFVPDSNTLQFITDGRSQKVAQIHCQPYGEICWYFPKTREQFRILGRLELVDHHHPAQPPRHQMWQTISDNARRQFTWAEPRSLRHHSAPFPETEPSALVPPDNFCLLWLHPHHIDRLSLKGTPQNRWLYELQSGVWNTIEVYP